ncbi:protein SPA1-RELATED 2 isoform X2 [Cornus florida]|uniref:protein SPA1-RELATED 2 isoform X2 n=1 Tax=Cornus florida TaxID=4283 RepID=UPI00289B754B|nr:protein SPA1-RELATED 2 isoform X2 [Cornus florida]
MDEGMNDEVNTINAIDGTHSEIKGGEYSLKADRANVLGSHEMITPGEGECRESSPHVFGIILESKNIDQSGAFEYPHTRTRHMDDTGNMVEELTLRNCDDGSLAIVGTSNNKDMAQTRQNQWQHLYQIAGRSGSGSSYGDAANKENGHAMSTAWENAGQTNFTDFWGQKSPDDFNEVTDSPNNTGKAVASNTLLSPGIIRTKILSKSGFCNYFVKNTLKGKGVICRGLAREGSAVEFRGQTDSKPAGSAVVASDALLSSSARTVMTPSYGVPGPGRGLLFNDFHDGVNLREWLKARHKVNKVESLYIFRQIVDLVNFSHSQGVALQDLRPSRFKLLPSTQVIYLGSSVGKEMVENVRDLEILHPGNEKRPLEQAMYHTGSQHAKKHKFGENIRRWPQFSARSDFKLATANDADVNIACPQDSTNEFKEDCNLKTEYKVLGHSSSPYGYNTSQRLLTSVGNPLEEKWYTSPEELNERSCTFSSNIYCLGVLMFELFGSFDYGRKHDAAMLDLHHRILPPNFLSENPKEAGFCLWLLHPAPSSRPTARDILLSDVISGAKESCGEELSSSIHQDDAESELLLHFLTSLEEQKQKDASKLVEEIKCLEADIEEVERRQTKKSLVFSCSSKESLSARGNRFFGKEYSSSEVHSKLFPVPYNELSLMRNISQLESAYFSMRSNIQSSDNAVASCTNKDILTYRQNRFRAQEDEEKHKSSDRLGDIFNGFCKYARYSKFEVNGILRNGDFNSSTNVICSLSFDRDEDYFATAGVSKKIKIYEFNALLNDSVDIHYPVIEMPNKSKLSCICWNNYIANYLASTDYDGVVKLWDAGTGQGFSQYIEHQKRAWSVDFSHVDPRKFASGSDDCSVKIWNINEKNSLCTIRNIANVCCVQFSAHSSHLLAFGSADYKTYCYDLRNVSTPWCILAGHEKAVSFVKFLDSETLVSASTDNTLKIWDLNKTSSSGLSTSACISTLRGHTNEKNFVGLSVADGYIACGSETNEVYAYYKSLPMPITSYKFGSIDPMSGRETDNDNGQFVSSVCWRQKSRMAVAANSSGCIKVLRMV